MLQNNKSVGSMAPYNFVKLTKVNPNFAELPKNDILNEPFNCVLEVYMDEYITLAISMIQDQLHHVAKFIMTGIHYVFPLENMIRKILSPSITF